MRLFDPGGLDSVRAQQPRPFIIGKLTGLEANELRLIVPDMSTIAEAVNHWVKEHGWAWDVVNAHAAFHPDDPDVLLASDEEILEANECCLEAADALIVHGFDDGTAMLGVLLNMALNRPIPMPALLLAHEGEELSRPLRALATSYPQLTIELFSDSADIYTITRSWLADNGPMIQSGPKRRNDLDRDWRSCANEILEGWKHASAATREAITAETGLRGVDVEAFARHPTRLAGVPTQWYTILISLLIGPDGRDVFDQAEIDAWNYWAQDKGAEYARAVFDAAMKERCDGKVARTGTHLGQPTAWERFATHWQRMAAGP